MTFQSLEELKQQIDESDSILSVEMRALRDAYGAGRLGVHVRSNISDDLAGLGLAHFPEELPDNQSEWVRVYKRGSQAAALIRAVTHPSTDADKQLRDLLSESANDKLKRIRAIVGD